MKALFSFLAVMILILVATVGVSVANLHYLFGIIIPYLAFVMFVGGFVYRVIKWGRSPVPFRIPTTCGQQKSLPWIKQNKIENPTSVWGVIVRMALEILLFRSLFRNTKTELREGANGPELAYGSAKWLWVGSLVFHWSFLIIVIRHLRFFLEPIPYFVQLLDGIDGILQIGLPPIYLTDMFFVIAVTFLFLRRIVIPQVKYISLPADYFPLFMIFSIATSGILMRYFYKVDIVAVKELAIGLAQFHPVLPAGIGVIFYIHIFLISILFAYFPLSKLMHMGGIFLSPTRNMISNNRMVRHINPWNHEVEVHTYEQYEDEFREKMKKAGIPVVKE
ncbi:sulfate reduction electron transfer complex DsrMKJOP subunit DsrM [Desulfosporosinus metallidurans]|uniref:Sulfite reduction-associated complex DsrMKJOP protein DsrM n=1 Tax=Desulfosporosinus metallidurans TaxID=1888891 RepID=A0A1Q8QQH0_9FIRM|nr:sulfate reduction electron transfer complex DsrMKJOP subunit DsrM [Desulfosporosinus metallidurans]OLN29601.1 Sulfite reduction-associated complex DsrMKJOP protein DsrM [Desulfosporosinus metallidurans]